MPYRPSPDPTSTWVQRASERAGTRIYKSSSWHRFRAVVLQRRPFCEDCLPARVTASQDVHHIVKLSNGGRAFDSTNVRALCHSCHSKVTRAGG